MSFHGAVCYFFPGASCGRTAMLLKLSDKINECLARAAQAHAYAKATREPAHKEYFLNIETAWLGLIEHYRFVEQAGQFIEDLHFARASLDTAASKTGFLVIRCRNTEKHFSTGIFTDATSLAQLPQRLMLSHCPHCDTEHPWWPKDAKLVDVLPTDKPLEVQITNAAKIKSEVVRRGNGSLPDLLGALVRAAIERTDGEARAAFYIAKERELHHVIGMPEAYARFVDGFVIGPQSLACGLAAFTGQPIITRDVSEDPTWKPWLWLSNQFGYRACWSFPVEASNGKIVGTFALYFKEPREATTQDLNLAATLTRAAAQLISPMPNVHQ